MLTVTYDAGRPGSLSRVGEEVEHPCSDVTTSRTRDALVLLIVVSPSNHIPDIHDITLQDENMHSQLLKELVKYSPHGEDMLKYYFS
jgi:hypothetical protein